VSVRIALPRELRIGAGTSRQLGEVLGAFGLSRPLIVTDAYLVGSGVLQRVLDGLGDAVRGEVFADTVPDPTTVCVEAAAEVLRAGGH